jgi:hypothetical protein
MSNFKSTKTEHSGSLFGELIFSYTRAQAIADRVLVDGDTNRPGSWIPLPCGRDSRPHGGSGDDPRSNTPTRKLKAGCGTCFGWPPSPARRAKPGCSRIAFEVLLHLEGPRRQYQTLILDIGPGDTPDPVITIGFPADF